MKRLHVELVLALQFDKAHRWSRRRLRDPLGVAIVVLLRLDLGSNIFRRHQPDVVAVAGEDTAKVMGAAARLHPDNTGRQLLRQPDQRLASHPAPHDNRAGRVEPDHAADVLAKINTENKDIRHSPSSS
jgi:hypothetical protein